MAHTPLRSCNIAQTSHPGISANLSIKHAGAYLEITQFKGTIHDSPSYCCGSENFSQRRCPAVRIHCTLLASISTLWIDPPTFRLTLNRFLSFIKKDERNINTSSITTPQSDRLWIQRSCWQSSQPSTKLNPSSRRRYISAYWRLLHGLCQCLSLILNVENQL